MRLPSGECIQCNNVNGDKILNKFKCYECKAFRGNCDIDGLIGIQAFERKSIEQIEKECGIKRKYDSDK